MKYLEVWSEINVRQAQLRKQKIQNVAMQRAKEDKLQLESEKQWERYLEQLENSRKEENETV